LNVHEAGGVRQTEIHTAELFVSEPSAPDVEVAMGKLETYKSPGADQIPAELNQAGGETLRSKIHKLKLVWYKETCLTSGNSQSWYLFTKRAIKQTVIIIEVYHSCQLHTKCYPVFFLGQLHTQIKIWGVTNVDFVAIDQRHQIFYIWQMLEKKGSIMVQHIAIY
jgi:hypothetical protein